MKKPLPKTHNPGGKIRLVVPAHIQSTAVFGGPADCYRYQLIRTWDAARPHAMFVMMNPSTADPLVDDPTVAKCGRLARAWNYGGIHIGNTFAYRATDQIRLTEIPDPIGPDNDRHLIEMAKSAGIVIFAYGQPRHPALRPRGLALARLMIERAGITPHILRLSKNGTPWHPLYLPESLKPIPWEFE
jgi:hypothetical protein